MSLAVSPGSQIVIRADGADEQEAVDALVELIHQGLGESD